MKESGHLWCGGTGGDPLDPPMMSESEATDEENSEGVNEVLLVRVLLSVLVDAIGRHKLHCNLQFSAMNSG